MKWRSTIIPAAFVLTFCACASAPTKVPVLGDASVLSGRWQGEFISDDGRSAGTIVFELRAGSDTAHGDVLLVPNQWSGWNSPAGAKPGNHAQTEFISISFVRVAANTLRGTLQPYRDPVSGCQLRTVFEGTLIGNAIQGRYYTTNLDTKERYEGAWRVQRSGPYADARVNGDHTIAEAK